MRNTEMRNESMRLQIFASRIEVDADTRVADRPFSVSGLAHASEVR